MLLEVKSGNLEVKVSFIYSLKRQELARTTCHQPEECKSKRIQVSIYSPKIEKVLTPKSKVLAGEAKLKLLKRMCVWIKIRKFGGETFAHLFIETSRNMQNVEIFARKKVILKEFLFLFTRPNWKKYKHQNQKFWFVNIFLWKAVPQSTVKLVHKRDDVPRKTELGEAK